MTFTVMKLLLFITVYLSLDTFLSLHLIRNDADQALKNSEKLIEQVKELDQIKQNTDRMVVCNDFPSIDSISLRFNPVLRKTFASDIEANSAFFRDGIAEGRLSFNPKSFVPAYIRSLDYLLETYKGKNPTILATSLADTNYLWSYQGRLKELEKGLQSFIVNGGVVKRVFLVEQNWEQDPYTVAVLNRQVDSLGVDVWIVPKSSIPKPEYFVVNKERDFMFEVRINGDVRIDWGIYHTNKEIVDRYLAKFEENASNSEAIKYKPRPLPGNF